MNTQPSGPFCQSCGMPLTSPEEFGTNRDGSKADEYCHYCYVDGAFVNPDITMQAMLDICVHAMTQRGIMPETQARAMMAQTLPRLKRWRRKSLDL